MPITFWVPIWNQRLIPLKKWDAVKLPLVWKNMSFHATWRHCLFQIKKYHTLSFHTWPKSWCTVSSIIEMGEMWFSDNILSCENHSLWLMVSAGCNIQFVACLFACWSKIITTVIQLKSRLMHRTVLEQDLKGGNPLKCFCNSHFKIKTLEKYKK